MIKHLIIGDTQVKPGIDLSYCAHIGKYIVEKRPNVIVHIGDHFDFPSLCSYDRGTKSFEGRRLKEDIDAGHEGMKLIVGPLRALQKKQKKAKHKVYSPRMIFTVGNHEDRFDRIAQQMPEFEGFTGIETLNLSQYGWEVHNFLEVVEVGGISYTHYLANPFSGRPYGGSALNQLKNVGRSYVVGHKQTLDIAIRPDLAGKMQLGIINGACYPHEEDYKGPQGNAHFRGLIMLHDVKEGYGDPMCVSLDYLARKYS